MSSNEKPEALNLINREPREIEHDPSKIVCPEPMPGYAVVRYITVTKFASRIYAPTPGVKGMETEGEGAGTYVKARVVKCTARYMRGLEHFDTPFKNGDFVMISARPNVDVNGERFPLMLPKDHRIVNIADIIGYVPGNLAELKALDS